jgi:hypothetical protein
MMSVEQSVEQELVGETEVLGENLPQCHFVHHKSHILPDLGSNPVRRDGKPATNSLICGTAFDWANFRKSLSIWIRLHQEIRSCFFYKPNTFCVLCYGAHSISECVAWSGRQVSNKERWSCCHQTTSHFAVSGVAQSTSVPSIALLFSWEVIRSLWSRVDAQNRNGWSAPFVSSLPLLFSSVVAGYVTSLSGEDPSVFALEALSLSLSNCEHPLRFCAPILQ